MNYRAVLFDLDGTLLDTLEDLADSTNRTLASMGFPTHPTDSYRRFVGDGVTKLIERALPAGRRDATTVATCIEVYKEDYGRNWVVKTRPYRGVPEMLDGLVSRRVKLAVLSNKPDEFTQLCVRQLLGQWHFDVVQGASKAFPNKPDPAAAIDVARRLGLKPAEVLYLGDSSVDMQTAVAAGMLPVGAAWGFRGREELLANGAKRVVDRPEEVVRLAEGK